MPNTKKNSWSKSELNKLLELKHLHPNITSTDLAETLNTYYYNGRTAASIAKKLYEVKRIFYTEQMDTIIIKHIREYPTNLQYAFKTAALELNVLCKQSLISNLTSSNISGRYYAVIRKKYDVITTGSCKGFSINVKNSYILKHPKRVNIKPRQHLKPVLWLMKEILTLSDKERKELITFLTTTI